LFYDTAEQLAPTYTSLRGSPTEEIMNWSQVRQAYPDQWLVIEALDAHTEDSQRHLDRIAVLESCSDGKGAFHSYQRLHEAYPFREFYFVHTGRETLDIRERYWMGIRGGKNAAYA
jgi:hypothetical protein